MKKGQVTDMGAERVNGQIADDFYGLARRIQRELHDAIEARNGLPLRYEKCFAEPTHPTEDTEKQ